MDYAKHYAETTYVDSGLMVQHGHFKEVETATCRISGERSAVQLHGLAQVNISQTEKHESGLCHYQEQVGQSGEQDFDVFFSLMLQCTLSINRCLLSRTRSRVK